MKEDQKVEEHLKQMKEWFDQLQKIDQSFATHVDWAFTIIWSLPESWDATKQLLQADIHRLKGATTAQVTQISKDITTKILEVGQSKACKAQEGSRLSLYAKKGPPQKNNNATPVKTQCVLVTIYNIMA